MEEKKIIFSFSYHLSFFFIVGRDAAEAMKKEYLASSIFEKL